MHDRPDWYYDFYPETSDELTPEQEKHVWSYYTIDVAQDLGKDLRVTNPEHALNLLDSDIKYENIDQFQDLIIEVYDDGDGFTDPNIYINLNDTAPNVDKFDLRCTFYGEDVCVISGSELTNTTKITIGVYCRKSCQYRIKASLEAEINLAPGKMHNIYFKENQQRIIRFQIPDDDSIEQIEVRGINENKFAQFEMLILKGNEVPDTSKALIMWPAWENGYLGKFYRDCYCFCQNCNYTMLVSSKSEGYISIGAKLIGKQQIVDLKSFTRAETYDNVGFWSTQCYSYTVTDATKDFRVKIQSFAGEPNVYVNPLVPIDSSNFTRAIFNTAESFWNEEMVLEPNVRKSHNALTGPYYICVYGQTSSNYKISAKNEDHSQFLNAGIAEGGFIEHNELKQFYYTDSILMDPNIQVKFDGDVMSGSFRMRHKLCPRPNDMKDLQNKCFFTIEEMEKELPEEKKMQHIGAEVDKPDELICSPEDGGFRKDNQAQCVYVIGVMGLSNYTSQFAVMIELDDNSGKNHPMILSEGVPSVNLIMPGEDKYFMLSIDDPEIVKLTIQLTTIHGDPDMYVSSTTKDPSITNFEQRSINAGLYPDMLIFEKEKGKNLTKNYYIKTSSWEESSFSMVYFTENSNGTVGVQKLMVGKKQKGVIHLNQNPADKSMPILDQPTLVYHFAVSSKMLSDNKEIEIRLNSEHGEFMYLVAIDHIPEMDSQFEVDSADQWIGGEISHVIIKAEDLDSELNYQIKNLPSRDSKVYDDKLINFYIRVYPMLRVNEFDIDKMPYVFNIAFYDEEQMINLVDGTPQRGVVTNQTFDYYFYDVKDLEFDYEISLGPISGGDPDLVISFNPDNQFPNHEFNDFKSNNQFSTDSIILKKEVLQQAINTQTGSLQIYIGVYTRDPLAIYSIVMIKKGNFNPIYLKIGEVLAGQVKIDEKKYYYTKTNGKTLKIDLIPLQGNTDVEITIIQSTDKNEWELKSKTPTFVSKNTYGIDTVLLDPETVPIYKELCGESCVVLIAVSNKNAQSYGDQVTSFKIQVSQDFEELLETVKVDGEIKVQTDSLDQLSGYKFYKFFKSCDVECDLNIYVFPHNSNGNLISVLINYEDLTDSNLSQSKLPVWQNDPAFTATLKVASVITVEGNEPWFYEHHGKNGTVVSKGFYFIGVQSYKNVSYSIEVTTSQKLSDNGMSVLLDTPLDLKQLYLGNQERDFYIKSDQTLLFYFKNWREESIKFNFEILNKDSNLEILIGKMVDVNDKMGTRIPRYTSQLPKDWIMMTNEKGHTIKEGTDEFCVFCTYIVKVQNKYTSIGNNTDTKFRITIDQQVSQLGEDQDIEKSFKSQIRLGSPQPIKLEKGEIIYLQFKENDVEDLQIDVEVLLGKITVKLLRNSDQMVLLEYPCTYDPTMFIQGNIINFDLVKEGVKLSKKELNKVQKESFSIRIECLSQVFEGIGYLRSKSSLRLMADGWPYEMSFSYVQQSNYIKDLMQATMPSPLYFIFLPTSHNFDLQINANMQNFQSNIGELYGDQGKRVSDGTQTGGKMIFDPRFFNFKISLKKIELMDDVKTNDIKWNEEFTHDEQFDYVLQSTNSTSGMQLYDSVNFEVEPESDIILVKVDGLFFPQYSKTINDAELTYSFQMSSSDITYLAPNKTVRGVVSNSKDKYMIYEFFVNSMQFPTDTQFGVDLFISLTPCSGKLEFFISDDKEKLFKSRSKLSEEANILDVTTNDYKSSKDPNSLVVVQHKKSKVSDEVGLDEYYNQFRVQGKRLTHINRVEGKKIYIGIRSESSHRMLKQNVAKEIFKHHNPFKPNLDATSQGENGVSQFEIKATYVSTGKPDLLDMYRVKDVDFGIQIQNEGGRGQKRNIRLTWSPVMQLDQSKTGTQYNEITSNIQYKIYFGYSDNAMNTFASQCQLEAYEKFNQIQKGRLLAKVKKNHNKDEEYREFSVQNNNQLTIKGNHYLDNLKSAVIMAHITIDGGEQIHLAYPPINFEEGFDFDLKEDRIKKLYLWGGISLTIVLMGCMVWYFLKLSRDNAQKNFAKEINTRGIPMSEIPSSSSRDTHPSFASSTMDSQPSFAAGGQVDSDEED